ncbi:substrate import-associated zinc metallohydrolase lipoprotein [Porphyromonas sp. COT-290 OH3588]|uniref:substrate import-associated zinc metallohydrolase lipoprotein n=1 Tax=Porphyromonas sp. COT-290 OH3588 TaxID=1515617 RepID=UPI0006938F6D|nr:substrate import-associated zinc metallohydrolase lipoprotein [Porphyromonas sp. COT-290 OH3588]
MNKFIFSALAGALSLLAISSCGKEKLEPRAPRVTSQYESSFDRWLKDNLLIPYNIDYKYRFESNESTSTGNNVVPASLRNGINIARTLKHTWLGSFDELAGEHFMRLYSPRIITLTGTPTVNDDGTVTLGQAEGGLKISLTNAEAFDASSVDKLNELFLHTMYHEFMHILHQNRIWDQNYSLLSASGYTETGWQNRHKTEEYASLGFVTAYSARNPEEDITEVTACYITFNDAQWKEVRDAAGTEGNAIIDRKIQIMKDYMLKEWKIDMDALKATATKRASEIAKMKLIEPEWEELINDQLRAFTPLSPKKAQQRELIINALLRNPKQLHGSDHKTGGHLCQFATQFRSEIAEAAGRSGSLQIEGGEYHVLNN